MSLKSLLCGIRSKREANTKRKELMESTRQESFLNERKSIESQHKSDEFIQLQADIAAAKEEGAQMAQSGAKTYKSGVVKAKVISGAKLVNKALVAIDKAAENMDKQEEMKKKRSGGNK